MVQFRGPCRKITQSLRKSSQTWQGYKEGLGSPYPDSSWLALKVLYKLHSNTKALCWLPGFALCWGRLPSEVTGIHLQSGPDLPTHPDPWSSE